MTTLSLMTRDDVATALSIDLRTVDRLRASGKLPAFRVAGRTTRFRREDVEALIVPAAAPGRLGASRPA